MIKSGRILIKGKQGILRAPSVKQVIDCYYKNHLLVVLNGIITDRPGFAKQCVTTGETVLVIEYWSAEGGEIYLPC